MSRSCTSRLVPAALAGLVLCAFAGKAQAGFNVCNNTDYPASVAIGFFDGDTWGSQGWWRVEAGECTELVNGDLPARYYYLYAIHEQVGGSWNGNRSFCVGTGTFRVHGRDECLSRGYDRKRFFQVDTRDALDWTETLSD